MMSDEMVFVQQIAADDVVCDAASVVRLEHFDEALRMSRRSVTDEDVRRYEEFRTEHGGGGVSNTQP